jgi:hypothetical protein
LDAYFLNRLAKQTLTFLAPDQKNYVDIRGCGFDLKVNKLDLLKSMKPRAFCDECRAGLLYGKARISAAPNIVPWFQTSTTISRCNKV